MSEIITVVAGIPRSGTSMMMKMLHAGGMPVFADDLLSYETNLVRELPQNWRWLRNCQGKAVKILDPHKHAPHSLYTYRFIWMDRNPLQQAKSSRKFMQAIGLPFSRHEVAAWARSIERDVPECLEVLKRRGEVLRVRFEDVLSHPQREAKRVADFCGLVAVDEMAGVVIARRPECLPYLLELELLKKEVAK